MLSIKKILIPQDGSDSSLEALNYASSFAREFKVTVYLMTVIEANQSIYDAYMDPGVLSQRESRIMTLVNKKLGEAEKKAREMGIQDVISIVHLGTPYKKIIDVAREEHIDLIVMGTHGRSGVSHFLIGSVTEKVIRTAPCPVLVIRPHMHGLIDEPQSDTSDQNMKEEG
jgi:nucleotide-binding universal stress UspA family protein